MISQIAYHDYLLMLYSMDAEWSRRRPRADGKYGFEPFLENQQEFTTKCCEYRDKVAANYTAFCRANDEARPGKQHLLAPFLFNPACYIPFGHADTLAIVLLDDFDPVQQLAAEATTTIEELCMAFCPTRESLGLGDLELVIDPHEIFGKQPRQARHARNDGRAYVPATHKLQEDTPLLVLTKYKVDGLGMLGQSLLFQQNLFAAMGKRIEAVAEALTGYVSEVGDKAAMMSSEDISTTRCVFLDLQGCEEIGTLFFSRNYSVAMAFVCALRSLTFSDVFDADPEGRLAHLLSESDLHRMIVRCNQELRGRSPSVDVDLLRDNHAFRWTQSSLAVSPRAVLEPKQARCSGRVEASSEIQILPGHRFEVEDRVVPQARGFLDVPGVKPSRQEFYRYHIGLTDLIVHLRGHERTLGPKLVPLKSVLATLKTNFTSFGQRSKDADHGRDVVDISTAVTVPIPKIPRKYWPNGFDRLCSHVGDRHFSPTCELLRKIRDRLCFTQGKALEKTNPRGGSLNFDELKKFPRQYGLPLSLRRTIEHLYQTFAILLGDPFVFDVPLDLYDTFATLHAVLTEHLPATTVGRQIPRPYIGSVVLDRERVEQLALLTEAIQNALSHRIMKAYREPLTRENAMDFRGGLNQILLAADAPVKCGLSLLRPDAADGGNGRTAERVGVGVVTRLSAVPGASCYSVKMGTEGQATLAFYEVDVPHVLNVLSYCDYLHECFHLILNTLASQPGSPESELLAIEGPLVLDRVSEVFATLMCLLIPFGSDKESFSYYYVCDYSKSGESACPDDLDTIVRFTEALIRLFMAVDAIPLDTDPSDFASGAWEQRTASERGSSQATRKRFEDLVTKVGPLFREYEELRRADKESDLRSYMMRQFDAIYPSVEAYMPQIWACAMRIYRQFLSPVAAMDSSKGAHGSDVVRARVKDALKTGKPIIRSLYDAHMAERAGRQGAQATSGECGDSLAPFFLMCKMIQEYVNPLKGMADHSVHLCRRTEDARVVYPKSDRPWFQYQIERGAAALFCPVPSVRRDRLKREIVVLKSFWDISSHLRARQLHEIITDNWAST
ncbi:MAG TPA: hypothetical protein VMZ31_01250 [Phycisphaerae bacterium]|nr:hypothetical protein [Phycisphaerae bacterium]